MSMPTGITLTAKQQQVYDLIKSHMENTGCPPTRKEIAQILGYKSANAAEEHIKALARKGALEIIEGASRGIRLPEEARGLPIVGRVAAGNPILAEQHIEDYAPIPQNFFHPPADYLLEVRGMSMKDAGILDGDLLAVKEAKSARNNDIVVARIDDEVTVKRYRREGNKAIVTLIPENEDFSPIEVDLRDNNFSIEGISVGVIRRG